MCAYWAVDTQLWVWSIPNLKKKKKSAPWRANFREPRSTALYPIPRYNEARYKEGRLYIDVYHITRSHLSTHYDTTRWE